MDGLEFQSNQDNSYLKRIISTNCYVHTIVPPDDGLDTPERVEVDEIY